MIKSSNSSIYNLVY